MKALYRSWIWVAFAAIVMHGMADLQWHNTGVLAADHCMGGGGAQGVSMCAGACDYDKANAEFEMQVSKLSQKKQAFYRKAAEGLTQKEKMKYYRRVALASLYFGDEKALKDDRSKAYVFLGPPAHISRSNEIRIVRDPAVMATRESFAAKLSAEVILGQPTFPVEDGFVWENWIYPNVLGGIELTFVEVSAGKFMFAPLPGGFDRPAPTKFIGYQGQFLYELAQKKLDVAKPTDGVCQALILADREEKQP